MGNSKRTAVILTALPVECKAVCSYLKNKDDKPKEVNGVYYVIGEFVSDSDEPWRVAVAEVGKGDTNAALETTAAIDHFKPECIFFVGVAGGIKDVRLSDVVVGDKVYDYEHGKEKNGDHPRPEMKESTKQMVGLAKYIAREEGWIKRVNREWLQRALMEREMPGPTSLVDRTPNAHIGPIATGRKLLADTKSRSYRIIKSRFEDTLAVEMESVGFLQAVHNRASVPAIVIRGISDLLENKSVAEAVGSQEVASAYAAAFTYEMLNRLENREAAVERENEIESLVALETEYDNTIKENIRDCFQAVDFDKVGDLVLHKAKEAIDNLPAGDAADMLCDAKVGLNQVVAWLALAVGKRLNTLRKSGADNIPLFVQNAREILGWLVLRAVNPVWLRKHGGKLRRAGGARIRLNLEHASCVEVVVSRAERRGAVWDLDEKNRMRLEHGIEISSGTGSECGIEPAGNIDFIIQTIWEHVCHQPCPAHFDEKDEKKLEHRLKQSALMEKHYYLTLPMNNRKQPLTQTDIKALQERFLLKVILINDSEAGQALLIDEIALDQAIRLFLEKIK